MSHSRAWRKGKKGRAAVVVCTMVFFSRDPVDADVDTSDSDSDRDFDKDNSNSNKEDSDTSFDMEQLTPSTIKALLKEMHGMEVDFDSDSNGLHSAYNQMTKTTTTPSGFLDVLPFHFPFFL